VAGYNIIRNAIGSLNFDSVGYVPETLPGEFVDMGSHPLQYAERFHIQPVDSCGNKHHYSVTPPEYAIFLQTFPSGNNTVNLNWSIYPSSDPNFELFVYIHRGGTPTTMQIIDTIPSGILNYTDITAPPGQQYYAVERRRYAVCDPFRIASGSSLLSSMSNPSVATVTAITEADPDLIFELSPVPVSTILKIKSGSKLIGSRLNLLDNNGKLIKSAFLNEEIELVDVSDLATGTYWIQVTGNDKITRKIMISR